jgi:hypothetical protein
VSVRGCVYVVAVHVGSWGRAQMYSKLAVHKGAQQIQPTLNQKSAMYQADDSCEKLDHLTNARRAYCMCTMHRCVGVPHMYLRSLSKRLQISVLFMCFAFWLLVRCR